MRPRQCPRPRPCPRPCPHLSTRYPRPPEGARQNPHSGFFLVINIVAFVLVLEPLPKSEFIIQSFQLKQYQN